MRGLGLVFSNHVGTGGVLDVCLCLGSAGVDGVMEWEGSLVKNMGGCRSRYMCIVLGGYMHIIGTSSVQS